MNEYKTIFARVGEVPPVLRVIVADDLRHPSEQLTLWRGKGEDGAAFYHRAQGAAHRLWLRHGARRWIFIECIYNVPSVEADPHFGDDERSNNLRALRAVADNTADNVDVRLAAIKAMNRIHGLVPAEAGW
jgi:hypothetical protein